MEQWKEIKGYPDYKVSNMGNVLSFRKYKKDGMLLKPVRHPQRFYNEEEYGFYVRVMLTNDKGEKTAYIHRLVAEAFLQNPYNKPCVNHKNGIKNDNRVENLEWCDYEYNSWHSVNVINKELYGDSKEQDKLKNRTPKRQRGVRKKYKHKRTYSYDIEKESFDINDYKDKFAVIMISKYGEIIKAFHNPTEAAAVFGKKNSSICSCCNRNKNFNMAYGYIWRYVKDFDQNEFGRLINRPVIQHTEWGIRVKQYEDLISAAKENDMCILNLIDCINRNVETAYGYKWCFLEDYKEVTTNKWVHIVQLDINGRYIKEYDSITNAVKDNDTACISGIYKCCQAKGKYTSGGYRWMYKEEYEKTI